MLLIEGPNNQKMLTKYNDTTITVMKSINQGNIAFYEKKILIASL